MIQLPSDGFEEVQRLLTARVQPPSAQAYLRLLHGRGGSIDAVRDWHIDQLGDALLVVAYRDTPRADAWLEQLSVWAESHGLSALWLQRRYERRAPISSVWGADVPGAKTVQEAGLHYELRFGNQNIGLFPDMAEGRRWVQAAGGGARVLNLFAYTCGFSVAAVAGGAVQVINMDVSKASLAWGRRNHQLNDQPVESVQYLAHNVMKSFGKIERLAPFDLIIVDPPSFQQGSFDASRDYPRMLKRLSAWLSPQGRALCCLNDPHRSTEEFSLWFGEDRALEIGAWIKADKGQVSAEQVQALKMVVVRRASR